MKHCFQFIDKSNGQRSKAFVMTTRELADELHARLLSEVEDGFLDDFFVLCIGDVDSATNDLKITEAPLLLGRSFYSTFYFKES